MPKAAQDLRVHGVTFEDAVKRMIAAPRMPPPKIRQKSAANAMSKRSAGKNRRP